MLTVVGLVLSFVVIPVLGVVAALLIPSFSRAEVNAEMKAQQEAAEAMLERIVRAEETFFAEGNIDKNADGVADYGTIDYLNRMDNAEIPYEEEGYGFHIDVVYGDESTEPDFRCTATPIDANPRQKRRYYVDAAAVIRYTDDGKTEPDENATAL